MAHNTAPPQVITINGVAAFKIPAAARLLEVTSAHIYNEIARGNIHSFTLGRARRISAAEIARIMGEEVADERTLA